jgi:hypothetical protein
MPPDLVVKKALNDAIASACSKRVMSSAAIIAMATDKTATP